MARKNDYQTAEPELILAELCRSIPKEWTIWEPCAGAGRMAAGLRAMGYRVLSTDISEGCDFMKYEPKEAYDAIVTNPPFNLSLECMLRADELGKPWAFLLPISKLEGQKKQEYYRTIELNLLMLRRRPKFLTSAEKGLPSPIRTPCAWFCCGIALPEPITFER